MNNMKRKNDRILKEELPRSVGAQHATGDQWRNNSPSQNEGTETKKDFPYKDETNNLITQDEMELKKKMSTINTSY